MRLALGRTMARRKRHHRTRPDPRALIFTRVAPRVAPGSSAGRCTDTSPRARALARSSVRVTPNETEKNERINIRRGPARIAAAGKLFRMREPIVRRDGSRGRRARRRERGGVPLENPAGEERSQKQKDHPRSHPGRLFSARYRGGIIPASVPHRGMTVRNQFNSAGISNSII